MLTRSMGSALATEPTSEQAPSKQQTSPQKGKALARFLWLLVSVTRGLAFFVASYSLISLAAYALGSAYNPNVWWIDLSFMPIGLSLFLQICLVFSLYAFVARIPRRLVTRICSAVPSALFGFFALQNVISVYESAHQGIIDLGHTVPFSLFILMGFLMLTAGIVFSAILVPASHHVSRIATVLIMALTTCLAALLFPLGQLYYIGNTEYLDKVDAVVVFGAQVLPDGTPSLVLQDRLDKAIELYREKRTSLLIMSGGIDIDDVSEADAMRQYAINQGVPASAIMMDEYGNNTHDTAVNTAEMIRQSGIQRFAAVSDYYHLARIKLEYLANGLDVATVPASDVKAQAAQTTTFLREIPGWWYCWFVNLVQS